MIETNDRFGRLIAKRVSTDAALDRVNWVCRCDCGKSVTRPADQLLRFERRGVRQSCGCWKNELAGERRRKAATHGLTTERSVSRKLYDVWRQMLQRCENPRCKDYPAYGKRGITVCHAWHDPHVFVRWAWSSGYQEGLTIERRNVNGHYRPGNCTWIPNPLQAKNTRKAKLFTYGGYTLCLSDWSRRTGIHVQTLVGRKRAGWSVQDMLTIAPAFGRNQTFQHAHSQ